MHTACAEAQQGSAAEVQHGGACWKLQRHKVVRTPVQADRCRPKALYTSACGTRAGAISLT